MANIPKPSEIWEEAHSSNRSGKDVANMLLNQENIVLCTPRNLGTRPIPNRTQSSTIDLTFSSPDLANLTTINSGPYWGSDHLPIIIQVNIESSPLPIPTIHWKFNHLKWDDWNREIESAVTSEAIALASSPQEAYTLFYSAMMDASNRLFPQLRQSKNPRNHGGTRYVRKQLKKQGKHM